MTRASMAQNDPELHDIVQNEIKRQKNSLVLIPSENYTSRAVLDALGSVMQNKYSEGYPGARYYGGNEFIDASERLCQQRALEAYGLDPERWGVNVQPHSGSPANFAVYTALMQPHDRLMALDLPHGGHLSHGYQTPTKKISAVSVYFESFPYRLNEETGRVNYDEMEELAVRYRPKTIVSGGSAYARFWDFERIRSICDKAGSWMLFDMAHISGLVAAGVHPSPFDFADVVTTTTHKSLRGPRGAMIFYRKGVRSVDKKGNETMYDLEDRINMAVFPGHQGGPHNHTITALATALKQANTKEFRQYQERVVENMSVLAGLLTGKGFDLVSGGTDNHLGLVDLRKRNVGGAQAERILELSNVALNKNTVPGDKSALTPGGIRLGTPAVTTRGMGPGDMPNIAEYLERGVNLAAEVQAKVGNKKIRDFNAYLAANSHPELDALRKDVEAFSASFPLVGVE